MILNVDAYDPSETDERPRATYVSKKDFRIAAIAIVIMAAILTPLFLEGQKQSRAVVCKRNIGQVAKALTVYMEANNDRFPPIYDEEAGTGEPALFDGIPATWMTKIYSGMERRASFVCPSSAQNERTKNIHPEEAGSHLEASYGMYRAWSSWPASLIQNPDQAIIVAETSNNGAGGTYNPVPFANKPDGFFIAWNNSNFEADEQSSKVTRLAFGNSQDGNFKAMLPARHDLIIHVLYVNGSLGKIGSDQANMKKLGSDAVGLWATR
jgi:hypothetical protein